jgi:hypothetical protein
MQARRRSGKRDGTIPYCDLWSTAVNPRLPSDARRQSNPRAKKSRALNQLALGVFT